MKHVRKALALMLATFLALVIAAPAFAANENYPENPPAAAQANPDVYTGADKQDGTEIKVTNAEAEKYSLYRVFDATYADNKIAYKVNATQKANGIADDATFKKYFELTDTDYVVRKQDKTDPDNPVDVPLNPEDADFKTFAEAFGTPISEIDNTSAANASVSWEDIPYGYYYITTTTGSLVTVNSTTPTAEVIDKNPVEGLKKGFADPANPGSILQTSSNEATLDEVVNFLIEVDAKRYDANEGNKKIIQYRITDTMDPGFSLVGDPVVKVGENTLVKPAYTITEAAGRSGFVIDIPWYASDAFLYPNGSDIVVTYSAKLDSEKLMDNDATNNVKFGDPNTNTALVRHFNEGDDPENDTPKGNTPEVQTKTYTTGVDITKTDGTNPLAGAEFTLTRTDGGTFTAFSETTVTTSTVYVEDPDGTWWHLVSSDTYTQQNPTALKASFDENDATTWNDYSFVDPTHMPGEEPGVPSAEEIAQAKADAGNYQFGSSWSDYEGYDAADGVNSSFKKYSEDTTQTTTTAGKGVATGSIVARSDQNGKIVFEGLPAGEYKIEETKVPAGYVKASDVIFTITFNPANTPAFTSTDLGDLQTNGLFGLAIENVPGTEFPETGGMGTRILYTVGGLMVAGAAIYLITKKRMASEA